MSASIRQLEDLLMRELGRVVIGAHASVRALTVALVARGHVLVQGVPGLGKTLLAKALACALGGEFKRIQGTADLMPSDIIGVHVFDEAQRAFVFRPGPLFADVVLVDEINRAGPKTQSALLEAMEERQVSVERAAWQLPADFLVIATQNPREFEGTYPLPESQLDRFMLRIDMDYPAREAEADILARYGGGLAPGPAAPRQVPARPAARRRGAGARAWGDRGSWGGRAGGCHSVAPPGGAFAGGPRARGMVGAPPAGRGAPRHRAARLSRAAARSRLRVRQRVRPAA